MRATLRIAILECDQLFGDLKRELGSLGRLLEDFLEKGALALNDYGPDERPNIVVSSYDVVNKQEYPNIDKIDAVFLSGSRHDSFATGTDGWILTLVKFIERLLNEQSRVRIMAVCFGHQIVARALGVMPERNDRGWEVSVTPVTLTEIGKQIFCQDILTLHQMHRDIVPRLPPSVENLGYTHRCGVQGLYDKGRVISLQGHPEYSSWIANQLLDLRQGSVIDDTTYRDGKGRANGHHHGVLVSTVFLRFLLDR